MADLEVTLGKIRKTMCDMIHMSGGGHFGGSSSCLEIIYSLVPEFVDLSKPRSVRDQFILSKGHGSAAFYALQVYLGLFGEDEVATYGKFGSSFQVHPDSNLNSHIDFSTGSLGQGMSVALGKAIWFKRNGINKNVWVVLGDGECQEGQVWEAAMLAARLKIKNLKVILDCNKKQEWGYRKGGFQEPPINNIESKWRAFGWEVLSCDGHNVIELKNNIRCMFAVDLTPSVLIAHTTKAYRLGAIAHLDDRSHYTVITDEECQAI